ncbi:MAG: 3-hydroxyacyl-CoA dehydrogenase NAD-binding domain-containing protein [Syntrophales bacterium]|jgi:3-hydroxybutyryl-CoA dehydrogenase|nr:3-hydroxyacyl-CoA dehydrogenase NAD-binding domain-containing protein [Syntrophales bacterium]MCK9527610.1 3-hydroxyacyl-CoA dehydrogenase NAD-binding domain-containing protein [Syntrophales bacterium]MDX9922227.1 3-hydroxyacyl-CoA dehydrogenase NAD-binding domain-containing protein [Syntrophales bacterium]
MENSGDTSKKYYQFFQDDIENILVVGAGTMGLQMAIQCAVSGCSVNVYDLHGDILSKAYEKIEDHGKRMVHGGYRTLSEVRDGLRRITLFDSLDSATKGIDMVSESVTEDPQVKKQLFTLLSEACSPKVILTTNTSTFTPSMFVKVIRYPKMFAAFHCHPPLWTTRIVDIMPHPMTSSGVVQSLTTLAERMGMIPLLLGKETSGYIYNSMLNALLKQALTLKITNVSSVRDIDRAWMGITGMTMGPFGIMDMIGIDTVCHVVEFWALRKNDDVLRACALYLKQEYLDKGYAGVKTKAGFYRYPNADFMDPEFLEGTRIKSPREVSTDGAL